MFAIFSCVFRYLNNIYSTTTTERYFIINAIELKLKEHETSLPNYSLNPGQAGASNWLNDDIGSFLSLRRKLGNTQNTEKIHDSINTTTLRRQLIITIWHFHRESQQTCRSRVTARLYHCRLSWLDLVYSTFTSTTRLEGFFRPSFTNAWFRRISHFKGENCSRKQ